MRRLSLSIQKGWLHRKGWRGRWITSYLHRYSGVESTERFHTHPWRWAFGIVLRGRLVEVLQTKGEVWVARSRERTFLSVAFYTAETEHRIAEADALTLFVGIARTQRPIPQAAEFKTPEGFAHYTELMPGEPGFREEFVEEA